MAFNPNFNILLDPSARIGQALSGVGGSIANAMISNQQQAQQQEQQAQLQEQQAQLQELQQRAFMGDPEAIQALSGQNPQLAGQMQQRVVDQQNQEVSAEMKRTADFFEGGLMIKDPEERAAYWKAGEENKLINWDAEDTQNADDPRYGKSFFLQAGMPEKVGVFFGGDDDGGTGANVAETKWFLRQPKEVQDTHLSLKWKENPSFAEKLAYEREKSNLKLDVAEKELEQELKFKPIIQSAVKLAEAKAAEQGSVFNDLARAEAAMPGLEETVGSLKELANVATSTVAGSIYDVAAKELGFGSTEGADAKAKFIATVNNQVLPLLKATFGGSFTVEEMRALQNTMGDPDASPSQKLAQLEAFITQKYRSLQGMKAQLDIMKGEPSTKSDEIKLPSGITVKRVG